MQQSLTIDTRGMSCPLPVLKVRKIMRTISAGEEVLVLATDPGAPDDLRAYCAASGCKFLSSGEPIPGQFAIRIQKIAV